MVDDRRNNCGDEGIAGLSLIPTSREEDMAAFDQLGPKTRATINFDLGVKWSSFMTLQYIRRSSERSQRTVRQTRRWQSC